MTDLVSETIETTILKVTYGIRQLRADGQMAASSSGWDTFEEAEAARQEQPELFDRFGGGSHVIRITETYTVERVHTPTRPQPAERYFLKADSTPWSEVDRAAFIRAERAAGFRSKGGDGELATGGFSGHGVSGKIVYTRNLTPESYDWDPEFNAVLFPEHANV